MDTEKNTNEYYVCIYSPRLKQFAVETLRDVLACNFTSLVSGKLPEMIPFFTSENKEGAVSFLKSFEAEQRYPLSEEGECVLNPRMHVLAQLNPLANNEELDQVVDYILKQLKEVGWTVFTLGQ